MTKKPGIFARVRTAQGAEKSLDQFLELRAAGKVAKAVVIVEHPGGDVTVLGQQLKPMEIGGLLLAATDGLRGVMGHVHAAKPEPHEPAPGAPKEPHRKPVPTKAITKDAEGFLVAPPGETIIRCGECNHPRWHITIREADEQPARFSCAYCGNELVMRQITHPGGRA